MQLERSRIKLDMSLDFRHAATASPDGPEPTMIGPGIHKHLDSSIKGSWTLLPSVSVKNSIKERENKEDRETDLKMRKKMQEVKLKTDFAIGLLTSFLTRG